MFYLIAPFIVRKNIGLLFCIFLLSTLLKILLWKFGYYDDPWKYRFFFSELSFFFIGMVMFRISNINIYNKFKDSKKVFLIGFLTFISTRLLYDNYKKVFMFYDIDFFKYAIYLLFAISLPMFFDYTKNIVLDRIIGELSYPIYIIHILILYFVKTIFAIEYWVIFAIILSIFLSILINKIIQNKIETIRNNNIKKALTW